MIKYNNNIAAGMCFAGFNVMDERLISRPIVERYVVLDASSKGSPPGVTTVYMAEVSIMHALLLLISKKSITVST